MVFNSYEKQQIVYYYQRGYRPPTIANLLCQENLKVSRVGVAKFLKRFVETRSLSRKPGLGRLPSITPEMKALVEAKMREDDKTTAYQLHALLLSHGYNISRRTILRCRSQLGWTFWGSAANWSDTPTRLSDWSGFVSTFMIASRTWYGQMSVLSSLKATSDFAAESRRAAKTKT